MRAVGAPQRLAGLERQVVARGDEGVLERDAGGGVGVDVAGRDAAQPKARGERGERAVAGAVAGEERALQLDAQALAAEGLAQRAHARLVVDAALRRSRSGRRAPRRARRPPRARPAGATGSRGRSRVWAWASVSRRQRLRQPRSLGDQQRQVAAVVEAQLGAVDRAQPDRARRVRELHRAVDAVVVGQRERAVAELERGWRRAPRAARRRRGTSRRSGSAARCSSSPIASSLAEPAPAGEVVEDDEVAPALADELPVAAAQRLLGPPAVLDQPGLAHVLDGLPVDLERLPAGGGAHPRGARQGEAAWRRSRLERGQHHAPLGDARVELQAVDAQGGVGPGGAAHLRDRFAQPRAAVLARPGRAAPPARRRAGRSARRRASARSRGRAATQGAGRARGASARGWASASRKVTSRRQLPPSTRRAASVAARSVRPRRSGRASRRSISTTSARSSASPPLTRAARATRAAAPRPRAGAGGSSSPQASRWASTPACAEAVGDRGARERRELAERRDPEPLERLDQRRGALARAQQRDRQAAQVRPRAARGRSACAAGASRAPPPARRSGSARRPGGRDGRARAAPPRARARRCRRAAAAARRARSRRARGAAARRRRRSPPACAASRSQAAATAIGSAASSSSSGQRASASPSAMPLRTPKAWAAPETSPIGPRRCRSRGRSRRPGRRAPRALRRRRRARSGGSGRRPRSYERMFASALVDTSPVLSRRSPRPINGV